MSVTEFVLWVTLGLLFWARKLHRRFPALGAYLALHVASTPVLLGALFIQTQPWGKSYFAVYFYAYWAVYIASAALLFFICIEIFRAALAGFPGLMKFGLMIFRWAIAVSIIVSLTTISYSHMGVVPAISYSMMHSVSILELCLLAFLCLSMNALRLSIRDLAFGVALGFGLMSASDFILASVMSTHTTLTDPVQFVCESMCLVALAIWVAYCAFPEPVRRPVMMPVTSRIYRWNEIASALGHTGTQVAVQQPANSFFLTDVEKVVEKVLNRNLKSHESES